MKKIIVISAINLREGGALSILKDILSFLDNNIALDYRVVALVHKKSILDEYENIELIEFPKSIHFYALRFYYEYFYFKVLSKKLNPFLWLSLHDITPNVRAKNRAVYCHNPTPFYKTTFTDFLKDPKIYLFSKFYKFLYAINIKSNDFLIVQQKWIGNEFKEMYGVGNIVVAKPGVPSVEKNKILEVKSSKYVFFYPSFPRSFKNFEVVCEAASILNSLAIKGFEVVLTIDGTENCYSNKIVKKYKNIDSIKFVGLLSREEVFKYYTQAETLVFPSKLETWGLPISEFQTTQKPMLVADLPYAYETVGNYQKVSFFPPDSANALAKLMKKSIERSIVYAGNKSEISDDLHAANWEELFAILLN